MMGALSKPRLSPLGVLAASLFLLRFGSTMTAVGLPLLVLHRYGAGLDSGLTLALEILPNVLFGAAVGDFIDRSDPRRFAILGPLLAAPFIALLIVADSLVQLQLLALLIGIGYMVGLPARMALRSSVITKGAESKGNGTLLAAQRLPTLLGPAVGAILLSVSYSVMFLVDAVSAVLAALLLLALPARPRPTASKAPAEAGKSKAGGALRRLFAQSIPEVVGAVVADRALAALAGTAFTYMFAFGMTRLFLAAYALSGFPHQSGLFGLLTAAMGAGAVVGSMTAARFGKVPQGVLYVVVNVVESCCWLSTVYLPNQVAAMVAVALAGVCESIGTVVFYTEAQTRLPANFEGRFFGMLVPVSDAFSVLGTATAGTVVATGTTSAAWIIAVAMALPVLLLCPLFLRRRLWQPTNSGVPVTAPLNEGTVD
ncbi:MFS transporter [Streptomyces sp. YGL11-2]|uniref:MFS transporter n=1 Tax=Streptomyces sp. YGL11-2 TaxID=3414028 RepID=UPI003CE819C8